MIKFVLTFSVFIVAATASSEFTVLSNPKSIEFRGNEVLDSQYVGDVLDAAMGHTISTDANWDGLFIKDPFDLSRGIVAILVEGIDHVSFGSAAKTYELEGNRGAESIDSLAVELQAEKLNSCNINFNDFDNGVSSYRKCFADVGDPPMDQSVNLKPDEYVGDRHFLQAIAYLKSAAKNFSNGRRTQHFLAIHIPLRKIVAVHGKKSEAMSEALNILVTATDYINGAAQRAHNNNALVVAIVSENSMVQRAKRAAPAGSDDDSKSMNLAKFYPQDYPVIFNIILWFMVVFGLALLAICYAIASMDPGRDSIIYRMTSTRMKKDN